MSVEMMLSWKFHIRTDAEEDEEEDELEIVNGELTSVAETLRLPRA
jgi:hypothetical protein